MDIRERKSCGRSHVKLASDFSCLYSMHYEALQEVLILPATLRKYEPLLEILLIYCGPVIGMTVASQT